MDPKLFFLDPDSDPTFQEISDPDPDSDPALISDQLRGKTKILTKTKTLILILKKRF